MLWTHASAVVPAFAGTTEVDLPVPCTFDFNVATTKYFAGLTEVRYRSACSSAEPFSTPQGDGPLQVMLIPWDKEADSSCR